MKLKLFLLLIVLTLISCDEKRVYDQYVSLSNGWKQKSAITFTFDASQTQKYNMYINIRANETYKYSNLFLIVSLENDKGFTKVDTLQYAMANPDGTMMGEGFTGLKESKLYYKENYSFDKTGKYKLKIQQAVRATGKIKGDVTLEGISEVGFRIEKQ